MAKYHIAVYSRLRRDDDESDYDLMEKRPYRCVIIEAFQTTVTALAFCNGSNKRIRAIKFTYLALRKRGYSHIVTTT